MYRVGILGTENSHALAFSKTFNLPKADGTFEHPEFKVVALYALEKAPSENIKATCGDDIIIVDKPEDMIPLVDCVMITSRHGKYHKEFAMPFIKAGKSCFIDKPFTCSIEDAKELIEEAKKNNVQLIGGSGCKFSPEILEMKEEVANSQIGEITSGIMNFPADINSEYGGIFFYGAHLAEMMMMIYGYDPISVTAYKKNQEVMAVVRYEKYDIVINFAKNHNYYSIAYGSKATLVKVPDISNIYNIEVGHFVDMIKSGKSILSAEQLLMPVCLLNAIMKSLDENKEVFFSDLL